MSFCLEILDTKHQVMMTLGYEALGGNRIIGRRYYRTHQVNAFVKGDTNLKRHLALCSKQMKIIKYRVNTHQFWYKKVN